MINTANHLHGHEVIEMMLASGKTYSRETLVADIHAQFGTDVRFYTCSAEGMDAHQLIDFLEQRGKFEGTPDAFTFRAASKCNHQ